MISVISGTDTNVLQNYIFSQKKSYNKDGIYLIESPINQSVFKDQLLAANLFSGFKKLMILKPETVSDINFDESTLSYMLNSKDVKIIIDLHKLKSKKIEILQHKNVEVIKFDKPFSSLSFKIVDEIFIYQNKKKALELIESIEDVNAEFYLFIGAFQYTLRAFLSFLEKNNFAKTLKPFSIKKLQSVKFSKEDTLELYNKLLELDLKSKSTSDTLKTLLIDFVLNI